MSNFKRKFIDEEEIVSTIKYKISSLNSLSELNPEDLVDFSDKFGDFLANKIRLKTNQIRKFLDAVNRIKGEIVKKGGKEEYNFKEESLFLKPKLAYAAGRKREVKPLMEVLSPCLSKINSKKDFFSFAKFVESIVAYHKYYGGRD